MGLFDLSLPELQVYKPEVAEPTDFDAFWARTLAAAQAVPLDALFETVDFGLKAIETYDVTFSGYGGQRIKGWLQLPKQRAGKLPCIVEFIGYGGGRGFPTDHLVWSAAGYAHLIMDTRGQGSDWSMGATADPEGDGANPHVPGFMTRGVLDPQTYYYRRVYVDGVRAVEAARSHPDIDPNRIAVTGGSQGGGIALAVSGLSDAVRVTMTDVPFLCHFRRATEIVDTAPYQEIVRYCKVHRDKIEIVFHTLSYFDGVNMAKRAKARALFSVGLMDDICPPSTVFAAYNHYKGAKEIHIYPYNKHEGGGSYNTVRKVRWLWETAQL